jgi:hypothetical protein
VPSTSLNEESGTESYANILLRFERDVSARIDSGLSWSAVAAAAIRAALEAAAADPAGALLLTSPATCRRSRDRAAFDAAVDGLVARIRRGAPDAFRSERGARNLILRLARQVHLQLERGPDPPVTAIAPDLIVFALTPCVGLAAARRLADQPIETS